MLGRLLLGVLDVTLDTDEVVGGGLSGCRLHHLVDRTLVERCHALAADFEGLILHRLVQGHAAG